MSQVGTERAGGVGPVHRVAAHARRGLEELAAGRNPRIRRGRLPLRRDPALELVGGMGDDPQQHVGVLGAAVLGTLAAGHAGLPWRQPDHVAAGRAARRVSRATRRPAPGGWGAGARSADCNVRYVATRAGTCSSFAVTTPRSGYWNSHHHWWPITRT